MAVAVVPPDPDGLRIWSNHRVTARRVVLVALPMGAWLAYTIFANPVEARQAHFLAPALASVGSGHVAARAIVASGVASRRSFVASGVGGAAVALIHVFTGPAFFAFDGLGNWFPILLAGTALVVSLVGAVAAGMLLVTASSLIRLVDLRRRETSADLGDRALFAAALWLGALGTLAWIVRPRAVVHACAAGVLAVALGAVALVLARDARRISKLADLHRGTLAGWAVVADKGQEAPDPPVPRLAAYADSALDAYLVRASPSGRDTPGERVAEMPRDAWTARAPFLVRAVLGVAALVALSLSLGYALFFRAGG